LSLENVGTACKYANNLESKIKFRIIYSQPTHIANEQNIVNSLFFELQH
jgi:hypothetical protein